ncbi:hypothetical protein VTI74DRAFT_2451 [Chaetomium olivicolor]
MAGPAYSIEAKCWGCEHCQSGSAFSCLEIHAGVGDGACMMLLGGLVVTISILFKTSKLVRICGAPGMATSSYPFPIMVMAPLLRDLSGLTHW